MVTMSAFVKRRPLVVFFVLACALTWPTIPLISVSPVLGLPGLFGPAVAAVIVAAITGGVPALKDLLGRLLRWRVGARWYAVALGLPALLALAAAGLHLLSGDAATLRPGSLTPLGPVLFVLIVGEELGWRGFALPRLLARAPALAASVVLGVLWAVWHLPTFFVPGAPQQGLPFTAYVLLLVAYSVLFTWVYLHTRGSVLLATLMHGAINLFQGVFLGGLDPARAYWLLVLVYGAAALAVLAASGLRLSRMPQRKDEPRSAPVSQGIDEANR